MPAVVPMPSEPDLTSSLSSIASRFGVAGLCQNHMRLYHVEEHRYCLGGSKQFRLILELWDHDSVTDKSIEHTQNLVAQVSAAARDAAARDAAAALGSSRGRRRRRAGGTRTRRGRGIGT